MTEDFLTITDLLMTNGVLVWLGLRIFKRVDQLDTRVDDHETRLQLTERRNRKGQFTKGFYQPCTKGSQIRKAKRK